ncbi:MULTISPECIES: carboxymuconolactone decarboxylase family protein [Niastella]|uniref:Carboxymuconolactone decarboxylase family protein n=1 Tax=Niastella soli TaxID=2821487 RepID=A0ABS3YZI8_9BACT|nr:carboxymuconolactone decarboxylase family protein [Niastella soli]MBO9202810.1 carboxymuconolactone decarboxylase family protein [Niastella soli]
MDTPFLTPVEKPKGLWEKLLYFYCKKKFGKVMTPLKVMAARMPFGFAAFSGKISQLDNKLQLPAETVMLVRQKVAEINVCHFCIDIGRARTIASSMDQSKFDELADYQTSNRFSEKERVLLDFVTMLTRDRKMEQELFDKVAKHYDERSICEIVWITATEFYYNIGNIGLNIHSDRLCDITKMRKGQRA